MTWSGFRPSDDANTYGYSIPSNMYAAGALQRALVLNRAVWRSPEFEGAASKLLADIESGECTALGAMQWPSSSSVLSAERL